ncbi:MAG TPA: dTDP-4-dehydrorhamnose 3,5-epimerase [Cyclobacteriaceae bacterium]|nr:dTDP-4-dehydrorhamnose 3,5-epimerase [Cyclobacteriaceae bacterium]
MMEGITVTPLKIIPGDKGKVMHAMTVDAPGFKGFGEAYFSTIVKGEVKGWKKHLRMVLNLVVVTGKVKFIVYDDRPSSSSFGKFIFFEISPGDNYQRLTIEPGLWMAFEGLGASENIILNLADIRHDPTETESCDLHSGRIPYDFSYLL